MRAALDRNADAILAINNDATVRNGAVRELLNAWLSDSRNVGLLAPRIVFPDGTTQSTGGYFRAIDASTRDINVRRINYLTWACVLVPRETLEQVGYLDERYFMYWEDVEYGLRVTDAGNVLRVVETAVVEHSLSKSHKKAGARIDRYSARGLVLLCLSRGGTARWLGLPIRLIGRVITRLMDPARCRAVIAGALDGFHAYKGKDR
jgi:GT2 family glycosyltransferase